jgi:hypothetical protein
LNRSRNLFFFNTEQHDFISQHLRYGREYKETASFSMKNILEDHIARSWPEELLQLVKKEDVEESLNRIEIYRGRHCHEPMIARVLQEAAKRNEIRIVQQLLDDGVHPDVCLKREEKTAFEVVGRSKDIGSSESVQNRSDEIRKLLYKEGAKIHTSPPSLPWTYWHGIGKLNPLDSLEDKLRELDNEVCPTTNSMGDEEFRGLKVEIYSRIPNREDSAKQQQDSTKDLIKDSIKDLTKDLIKDLIKDSTKDSTKDGMDSLGKQTQDGNREGDQAAELDDHEFHRLAHPTVEELIYGKGPNSIMGGLRPKPLGPEYQRFRWIHIPMNHVSETRQNTITHG